MRKSMQIDPYIPYNSRQLNKKTNKKQRTSTQLNESC